MLKNPASKYSPFPPVDIADRQWPTRTITAGELVPESAIGAAVAMGLRRASVLVAILSAPLYAPALIFGVGAAQAGAIDSPQFLPSVLFLAAITLFAALLGPIAGAAAIRLNLS